MPSNVCYVTIKHICLLRASISIKVFLNRHRVQVLVNPKALAVYTSYSITDFRLNCLSILPSICRLCRSGASGNTDSWTLLMSYWPGSLSMLNPQCIRSLKKMTKYSINYTRLLPSHSNKSFLLWKSSTDTNFSNRSIYYDIFFS